MFGICCRVQRDFCPFLQCINMTSRVTYYTKYMMREMVTSPFFEVDQFSPVLMKEFQLETAKLAQQLAHV